MRTIQTIVFLILWIALLFFALGCATTPKRYKNVMTELNNSIPLDRRDQAGNKI